MAGAEQEGREPALRALKLDLNGVLTDLRRPSWTVQRPDGASDAGEANELHALFDEGGITRKVLLDIVGASSPAGAAEKQLARAELSARLDRAMERLAAAFCAPLKKAEEKAPRLIGAKPLGALSNLLLGYYNRFESFDAVTLPLYHPDLSEVNQVEIVRVSPEDARSLIDESKEGATRGKLAGTSVAHFGGFLDEHWRRNDLMWGRLDGVERILVSMLPEGTHRTDLLNEAQAAIIREELLDEDAGPLTDLMAGALSIGDDLSPADVTTLCTGTASQQRQAFLLQLRRLPDPILLAHFRAHYEVPRELDRAKMLKLAGRGTRITGDVMRGSSEKRGRSVKAWFWVSRLGGLLWGFAELAVPDPDTWLTTRLRRNAIQLALIVAAALIVLGLLLGFDGTQKVGWVLLLAVLAGTAMVWIARDLMTGQRFGVLAVAIGLLVAVILVFAGLEAVLHFKADLRSVLPGDEHQGLERLIFNGVRSLWPG